MGDFSGRLPEATVEVRVEFVVVDLGAEKLVARYVGAPEPVAFNASVLRASLMSLEGDVLGHGSADLPMPVDWSPAALAPSGLSSGRGWLPAGWLTEPLGPLACPGLPRAAAGVSASPAADFTTALRIGSLYPMPPAPDVAAAACGETPRRTDTAAYERRIDWLGVSYLVVGRFVTVGPDELLQFEGISTADRADTLRALVARWQEALRQQPSRFDGRDHDLDWRPRGLDQPPAQLRMVEHGGPHRLDPVRTLPFRQPLVGNLLLEQQRVDEVVD